MQNNPERVNVIMTYDKYIRVRGFKGHYAMNYVVSDVRVAETNELICSSYTFKSSKIFKGLGLHSGDKVKANVRLTKDENGVISMSYYSGVEKFAGN